MSLLPKAQPEDVTGLGTVAQEPARLAKKPSVPARGEAAAPAGAGMAARYEQLALGPATAHPGGLAAPGQARGAVR